MTLDMATRPFTKAPASATPAYNWTGFDAGLNGGYGWSAYNDQMVDISNTMGDRGAFGGLRPVVVGQSRIQYLDLGQPEPRRAGGTLYSSFESVTVGLDAFHTARVGLNYRLVL